MRLMNKRNYTIMMNSASKRKKRLLNDYNINRSILLKKNSKIKLQNSSSFKKKRRNKITFTRKRKKRKNI